MDQVAQRMRWVVVSGLLWVLLAPTVRADEYEFEILFDGGVAQVDALPGEIVSAQLWLEVPVSKGLSGYSISVRVPDTDPSAVIADAVGFLPPNFVSYFGNPRTIYQPGSLDRPSHHAQYIPDGIVHGFSASVPLGGGIVIPEGRLMIARIDVQVPCAPEVTLTPLLVPGDAILDGDRTNDPNSGTGDPIFRTGTIQIDSTMCGPEVLLGLSDSTVETGSSVLLSWHLNQVHSCKTSGGWRASLESSGEMTVRLTETTEFGIQCVSDDDGEIVETFVVVEVFQPPTAHVWLDPPRVGPGEATTVHWKSDNSVSCVTSFAPGSTETSGAVDVVPGSNPNAEVLCAAGLADLPFAISLAPFSIGDQGPSLQTLIAPLALDENEAVTVTWEAENTAGCAIVLIEGETNGTYETLDVVEMIDVSLSGTLELEPHPTFSPRFRIDVDCDDIRSRSEIAVRPRPRVDLAAQPLEIAAGQSASLSWSSIDTLYCVAGGDWSGEQLMSGELEVAPATTSVYELDCEALEQTGAAALVASAPAMVRDSVTITVIPAPEPARWLLHALALTTLGVLRRRHQGQGWLYGTRRGGCE